MCEHRYISIKIFCLSTSTPIGIQDNFRLLNDLKSVLFLSVGALFTKEMWLDRLFKKDTFPMRFGETLPVTEAGPPVVCCGHWSGDFFSSNLVTKTDQ